MKKFIIAILIMVSQFAYSGQQSGLSASSVGSAGFDRLSDAEKAEIIKAVADKAATKTVFGGTKEESVEKVERWVKIGSNIGQGLAGAAKEVGVAVNEFSTTPVGQLTMVLIVWHMIGAQLVHVVAGILIWVFGYFVMKYLIGKTYPDQITYDTEKTNIFGNYVVKEVKKNTIGDPIGWSLFAMMFIAAGIVVIFTF